MSAKHSVSPEINHAEKSKTSDQPQTVSKIDNDNPVRIYPGSLNSFGIAFIPKEFKLPGFSPRVREAGGLMLSVIGLNHF